MYRDLTLQDPMEATTDYPRSLLASRNSVSMGLSAPECVLHRNTIDLGTETPQFETGWTGSADLTSKQMTPSFMEAMVAGHIVTKANEDMAGTVAESEFVDADCKQ